jgi:hypothetical protein
LNVQSLDDIIDSHEVAWAAGFFDGEGSTTFSNKYMYMQLKQVDENGIRRFHKAVGGLGYITYHVFDKLPTRNPIFMWRCHGKKAIKAKEILWPYLGTAKKEQWLRCFEKWDKTRHGKPHCRNGHLFSEDNIYHDKRSANLVGRKCRIVCVGDDRSSLVEFLDNEQREVVPFGALVRT